jgi:diadenosine tetraphosphate (Ap4A) HIT family hydrolase
MVSSCPFCQLAAAPPAKTTFLRTPYVLGVLDIQPLIASDAHLLLIPTSPSHATTAAETSHAQTLDEVDPLNARELGYWLATTVRALKTIITRARSSSAHSSSASSNNNNEVAINIVQNNGAGAGQVVDHVHFHIILRQSGTVDPCTRFLQEQKKFYNSQSDLTGSGESSNSSSGGGGGAADWTQLRNRISYYAQVYGRGPREDLDEDSEWNMELVAALRQELSKIHEKNEKAEHKL